MDRKEIYAQIKKLGLEETVKVTFGKNYTQVGNRDLLSLIEKKQSSKTTDKVSTKKTSSKVQALRNEMEGVNYQEKYQKVVKAIAKLLIMIPSDVISEALEVAATLTPESTVEDVSFTDADLRELFKK